MDLDGRVKEAVYRAIVRDTTPPDAGAVATALQASTDEVEAALWRLHAGRGLVLHEDGTVRMAQPFSGVETPHRVVVGERTYWANCSWDALGVVAALGGNGDVRSICGYSGEAIDLHVLGGQVGPAECVAHFAVPAARWWEDIVFT